MRRRDRQTGQKDKEEIIDRLTVRLKEKDVVEGGELRVIDNVKSC